MQQILILIAIQFFSSSITFILTIFTNTFDTALNALSYWTHPIIFIFFFHHCHSSDMFIILGLPHLALCFIISLNHLGFDFKNDSLVSLLIGCLNVPSVNSTPSSSLTNTIFLLHPFPFTFTILISLLQSL